jgi:hypothetical protein
MKGENYINEINLTKSDNKWLEYHTLTKERTSELKSIDKNKTLSLKIWSIIVTFLSALIFDRFFVEKNIGISFFIYWVVLLACFYVVNKENIKFRKSMGWFLLIPSLLISFSYTIHNNMVLRSINIVIVPVLFTFSFLLIIYNSLEWYKFNFIRDFFKRIFPLTIENMFKPFSFLKELFASKNKTKSINKDISLGILVTLPVLFIVLFLLSSSDLIINYYITHLFSDFNFDFDFGHILIIFLIFIITFGFMWSFHYPIQRIIMNKSEKTTINSSVILVLLVSLSFVYLLFTLIQSSYLYTSGKSLPTGITYANYARTGFFQLLLVTLINLSIVYFTTKYIEYKNNKAKKISKILLCLIVLFTINMLYASHFKLSLYENYYGFTYLRFYVHYTIITIFILLVIALISVISENLSISKYTLVSLLVMYTIINFFNVDGFIAKNNIQRYNTTGKLDISYNMSLSADAFEEISSLKDESNKYISDSVDRYIDRTLDYVDSDSHWYEFNIRNYTIKKFINK